MQPPTEMRTERLYLRAVRATDAPGIFRAYANDVSATRFMNFRLHRDLTETEAFIKRCELCWRLGLAFPFAVVEVGSSELIGSAELRLAAPAVDFGYILGRAFWGRGYGTELARAIVAWAVAQPNIFRVWATCHPENEASAAVLRKAGLSFETTLANWESRPQLGELAGPSDCYALVKSVA